MKTHYRFIIIERLRQRGTAVVVLFLLICTTSAIADNNDSTMVFNLSPIGIEADIRKDNTINPLIYGCGRSFIPEEAHHYAGALGDPGRMVRSYAGVQSLDDSRNDMAVRGNSPSSILWRIDGFEIDNPNHFSSIGLTGSTVTLLNIGLMSQSDFITSAFPAEYGNALGGIFDIHLKKAGTDSLHYKFGVGWNGFEGCVESPRFNINTNRGAIQGGVLCCYRYSFLDLMSQLGLQTGTIPKYQDLTVKSDIQINDNWNYSLLFLRGNSLIELNSDRTGDMKQSIRTGSEILFAGNRLEYESNDNTLFSIDYSISKTSSIASLDTFSRASLKTLLYSDKASETKQSVSIQMKHHNNKSFFWNAGLRWDHYRMNMIQEENWRGIAMDTSLSTKTSMSLSRSYIQASFPIASKIKIRGGLHTQYLDLNQSYSIEPRLAVMWRISDRQKLSIAYGKHSQTQIHSLYFYGKSGENRQLGFSQGQHFNLSHHLNFNDYFRIKTDLYWQGISHIPVENNLHSSFSTVNVGNDFYVVLKDRLVNQGEAKNYGFELTAERFWNNHWYVIANTTLFRSKYKGGDMKWRPSAYDLKHIINMSGGYEFSFNDKTSLRSDIKITHSGGRPYTPADERLSKLVGYEVPDESMSNLVRYPAYFRIDWKLSILSLLADKIHYDFSIDLQNLTNRHNILYKEYRPLENCYVEYYQTLFYPMYTLRIRW